MINVASIDKLFNFWKVEDVHVLVVRSYVGEHTSESGPWSDIISHQPVGNYSTGCTNKRILKNGIYNIPCSIFVL